MYLNVSGDFILIKKFLNANFLSVNIPKTWLVFFSNGERKYSSRSTPYIILHAIKCGVINGCSCQALKFVNEYKYLRVIFDSKMSFKQHIYKLANSIRKLFYKFKILRDILSYEILRMVYFSLSQSLLLYGILAWGNAADYFAKNIVIKIILRKHPRYDTLALYEEFNVLNLRHYACVHLYKLDCTNQNLHMYPTRISNTKIILTRFMADLYLRHAQIVGLRMAIKYRFNRGVNRDLISCTPTSTSTFISK